MLLRSAKLQHVHAYFIRCPHCDSIVPEGGKEDGELLWIIAQLEAHSGHELECNYCHKTFRMPKRDRHATAATWPAASAPAGGWSGTI
jgi:hypothetical protein